VRLNISAGGQTEEAFVDAILMPYLAERGIFAHVRLVASSSRSRGGMTTYAKARRDIIRWMREDRAARFTTMFDLYALPGD